MHVLSRKSFAGPAALRSQKLTVSQSNTVRYSAICPTSYSDLRAYSNYILSLAKQRH